MLILYAGLFCRKLTARAWKLQPGDSSMGAKILSDLSCAEKRRKEKIQKKKWKRKIQKKKRRKIPKKLKK
jgi:hypothetical protein